MSDTADRLVEILRDLGGSVDSQNLLDAYKDRTGDNSNSVPRMALIHLISRGIVEWGSDGSIILGDAQ